MKTKTYIIFLSLLSISNLFATGQIADIIIIENDTLRLFSTPLESYFNDKNPKPKPLSQDDISSLWRGYQAVWQIDNDKLYLIEIDGLYSPDSIKSELEYLFPGYKEKVHASWYTGKLICPLGRQLFYIHSGFQSIYEKEIVFSIDSGHVISKNKLDNSKTKISEYYKDSDKLARFIYTNIDWEKLPNLTNNEVRILSIVFSNEYGKIDSVEILSNEDTIFMNEAKRVLMAIPEWNILYRHGELVQYHIMIPIYFSQKMRKQYSR